jgi:hypothetical protein
MGETPDETSDHGTGTTGAEIPAGAAGPEDHGEPGPPKKTRRRIDVHALERAYTRGFEEDGLWVFPSLDEVADRFGVSRRQVGEYSRKLDWPALREKYRTETASALAGVDMHRRIVEADRADRRTLRTGYRLLERVDAVLETGTNDDRALKNLGAAGLAARKLISDSLGITREDAMNATPNGNGNDHARSTPMDPERQARLDAIADSLAGLEGEDFLKAVDAIMGTPPHHAGRRIIDVPALPVTNGARNGTVPPGGSS